MVKIMNKSGFAKMLKLITGLCKSLPQFVVLVQHFIKLNVKYNVVESFHINQIFDTQKKRAFIKIIII